MTNAAHRPACFLVCGAALWVAMATPWAQNMPGGGPAVSFNGSLGSQAALLVIDGEARTVAVGSSVKGVRLVSLEDNRVMIEIDGKRQVLQLGASPGRVGNGQASGGSGRKITLSSGPGGHFTSAGSINGQATQFLVDTGATVVSISQAEADRMNLNYKEGRRVMTQTANGAVPAHVLSLGSVRIGDVELRNVEAIVTPGQMNFVLLGNSFLSRFQMKRENEVMTLDLRY
ncbi:retropepsin-like aspartic protease family protein [Roseateles koreensis]|uniref:Retropepsin-like aspartic protease n=1 Tax=Roseateles koreensis TaxID=2987526 RepID=A0ABT5KZF4_9BURK|nr:retropepsin-like aspartic protease [Roseateles koreensis]MDC8787102.1 retropepsin-like aspartic protease [Roseateles koreensis]